MSFDRVLAIALRQFYLFRGSPTRVVSVFAWVAIDILLWGFITRYLNLITDPGFDFVPALLGAVLLWDFLTRVMFGVTMGFLEDVWSRNFLNLFASPLRVGEYLLGLIVSSITTSVLALLAMLLLATAVFGLSLFAYGAMLLPFLLILFLFGITLGILGAGLMLRFGPAAEWFIWPIPALVSPFVGVFYPLDTLPLPMQVVSYALPPSYVFEGMRAIVIRQEFNQAGLLLGAALAIFYIFLASWMFARIHRRAVRTGLIARYSAETLS